MVSVFGDWSTAFADLELLEFLGQSDRALAAYEEAVHLTRRAICAMLQESPRRGRPTRCDTGLRMDLQWASTAREELRPSTCEPFGADHFFPDGIDVGEVLDQLHDASVRQPLAHHVADELSDASGGSRWQLLRPIALHTSASAVGPHLAFGAPLPAVPTALQLRQL